MPKLRTLRHCHALNHYVRILLNKPLALSGISLGVASGSESIWVKYPELVTVHTWVRIFWVHCTDDRLHNLSVLHKLQKKLDRLL